MSVFTDEQKFIVVKNVRTTQKSTNGHRTNKITEETIREIIYNKSFRLTAPIISHCVILQDYDLLMILVQPVYF